jgi:hypothetical protein
MRRTVVIVIACLSAVLVAAPAASAGGRLTVTTVQYAPLQGIALDGVCPFPVVMDERGSRTVTTVSDRSGRILAQHLTSGVEAVLTNTANGVSLVFDVGATDIVYHADGTATVFQYGSSGIAYDQGHVSGGPSLTWFAGTAITKGTVDQKDFTIDVTSQRITGLADDVCEMLLTGLKTRH